MPDDQFNSMQANLGVLPGMGMAPQMQTPTPGETSVRLMEQARQQQLSLQSASMAVSQQFQQRMQVIQQQQSMNPFVAQAMSQQMPWSTPGYQGGMLPSPITMTPPSTGVFRPPPPPVTQPIPQMYTPPLMQTPFTPQMTAPMFQTPYEQYQRAQEQQQQRMMSYGSQIPYGVGTALGIAGGAYAGSRLGGAIGGGVGRLIGAVGGAVLAGGSGFASGVGNVTQAPFNPMVQTQHMGAAVQRMSQDWVVSGSQLGAGGRGLSLGASNQLAQGFRDMSSDRNFQQETGGMFNRGDMMRMTGLAGQAGLLDMAQSVPQIQGKMREVARTVKEFMQLTNDPDVTNVIREMGRLQQFGLNPQQMQQAAANMKMFSRAAGTSIQGLQQMGGLPGAMTYQQAGLTAGQGFEYGNYSAASARQAVATGTYNPQQLAMMGGVQGLTQRNTQAQAAFMTMPLMGAAFGQYGAGGWGLNQGAAANVGNMQGGSFGLVNQAVGAMNQAVRRGGLGALAMFPTQQREIQAQLAAELTPQQQTAMRFQNAMQTGQALGLRGMAALSAGSQQFGTDVAQQMMAEARNPEFWQAQRDMIRRRQTDLAMQQRARNAEIGYGVTDQIAAPFRSAGREISSFAGGISTGISRFGTSVGNFFEDRKALQQGIVVDRVDPSRIARGAAGRRATSNALLSGRMGSIGKGGFGGVDWSGETLRSALDWGGGGNTAANAAQTVGETALSVAGPVGAAVSVGKSVVEGVTGVDFIREGQNAALSLTMDSADEAATIRPKAQRARAWGAALARSKVTGKDREALMGQALTGAAQSGEWGQELKGMLTSKKGDDAKFAKKELTQREAETAKGMNQAAGRLALKLKQRSGIMGWMPGNKDKLETKDIVSELRMTIPDFDQMSQAEQGTQIAALMANVREVAGPKYAESLDKTESEVNKVHLLATKDAVEHLRKGVTERVEQNEDLMDLTGFFGGDNDGTEAFRKAVSSGGKASDVAMLNLQLRKMADPNSQQSKRIEQEKEALKKQMQQRGEIKKGPEGDIAFEKMFGDVSGMKERIGKAAGTGWDEDLEERVANLHGGGAAGGAVGVMQKVEEMQAASGFETQVAGLQALGLSGAIESAAAGGRRGSAGVGGLYGSGLAKYLKGKEGQADIARMKEEGGAGRKKALLMQRVAESGGKDKRAAELLQRMVEQATTVEEKKETATTSAGGEEAQKLKASDDAMQQMQASFASFAPAVEDFSAGAKALREAMENEWLNRNREG